MEDLGLLASELELMRAIESSAPSVEVAVSSTAYLRGRMELIVPKVHALLGVSSGPTVDVYHADDAMHEGLADIYEQIGAGRDVDTTLAAELLEGDLPVWQSRLGEVHASRLANISQQRQYLRDYPHVPAVLKISGNHTAIMLRGANLAVQADLQLAHEYAHVLQSTVWPANEAIRALWEGHAIAVSTSIVEQLYTADPLSLFFVRGESVPNYVRAYLYLAQKQSLPISDVIQREFVDKNVIGGTHRDIPHYLGASAFALANFRNPDTNRLVFSNDLSPLQLAVSGQVMIAPAVETAVASLRPFEFAGGDGGRVAPITPAEDSTSSLSRMATAIRLWAKGPTAEERLQAQMLAFDNQMQLIEDTLAEGDSLAILTRCCAAHEEALQILNHSLVYQPRWSDAVSALFQVTMNMFHAFRRIVHRAINDGSVSEIFRSTECKEFHRVANDMANAVGGWSRDMRHNLDLQQKKMAPLAVFMTGFCNLMACTGYNRPNALGGIFDVISGGSSRGLNAVMFVVIDRVLPELRVQYPDDERLASLEASLQHFRRSMFGDIEIIPASAMDRHNGEDVKQGYRRVEGEEDRMFMRIFGVSSNPFSMLAKRLSEE